MRIFFKNSPEKIYLQSYEILNGISAPIDFPPTLARESTVLLYYMLASNGFAERSAVRESGKVRTGILEVLM